MSESLTPSEEPSREIVRKERDEDVQLQEILKAFFELDEESVEEGYERCLEETKDSAKCVVKEIYEDFPHKYQIYPTEDREVAIYAGEGQGKGRGVLILCDAEGGASCFVAFHGKTRSAHYSSIDEFLRSSFLEEALSEFKGYRTGAP